MTQLSDTPASAPTAGTTITPGTPADPYTPSGWSPMSWRSRPAAQAVEYPDPAAVEQAAERLRALPPLVTSWEIERLKSEIAEAQTGRRFLLQGGDCAETLDACQPDLIANKLKILLQMSLVLVHGLKKPVTRVGRFAGQYAKPRSSLTEKGTVGGREVELASYFGDLVNGAPFTEADRRPDPERMVAAYQHSAMTLNFIRSLLEGGFADMHHPEQWDLSFFAHAGLNPERRAEYEKTKATLSDGLRFMEALGENLIHELTRVEFFTSHEGLSLWYESAQTRRVPRRQGYYDLTCHLPWIGERTRQPDGAHVEFFRGIRNPVGIKIGPKAVGDDVWRLIETLNPAGEPGKIMLICRQGADHVEKTLQPIVEDVAARAERHHSPVCWVCDPMHGNGIKTSSGIKTRNFDHILREIEVTIDVHRRVGTVLGGVHFELTGEDVTECIGGAAGVGEQDLGLNYTSLCDPRLNYQQSLELGFLVAGKLGG